jgi:hypothetical protein
VICPQSGTIKYLSIIFVFVFIFVVIVAFPAHLLAEPFPESAAQHYFIGKEYHSEIVQEQASINSSESHTPGTLQIPFSGLTTRSLTPSFAARLGLDDSVRGALITDIVPGSPAESLGLRPMNLSSPGSAEEIIASRGDIIQTVDGSAAFNTEYRGLEQYIIENKRVGDKITLNILRDGELKDIELILAAKPPYFWYENANSGISVKYPSDWQIAKQEKNQTDQLIARFYSAETISRSSVNLPVVEASVFKYNAEYNDTSEFLKPDKESSGKVFRLLDFSPGGLGNSTAYTALYYDYSQQNNNTRKVFAVFTERGSSLFSINFAIDPVKSDEYLPLIAEMIKSFQFT